MFWRFDQTAAMPRTSWSDVDLEHGVLIHLADTVGTPTVPHSLMTSSGTGVLVDIFF